LPVKPCVSQDIVSKPYAPCCDDGSSRPFCEDGRKSRSVTFSGIIGCNDPGQGEASCIHPAETLFLSIDISTQSKPGSCCSECSCSGDPHCYSFDAKLDDFIICDGRDVNLGCEVTEAVCLTQKDQLGNTCMFDSKSQKCEKDMLSEPPIMLFYQNGETSVTLELGERGIISRIIIKEVNSADKSLNILTLTSDDCINFPKNPWVGIPIGSLKSEKNGKIWKYVMSGIKSQLAITCVARGTVVHSPRLDVSIVDVASVPGGVPVGAKGFCGTGKVDKLLATSDVSDAIRHGSLCSNDPISETAQHFGKTNKQAASSIKKIVKNFCKKYMGGVENTETAGTKACADNILLKSGVGWAKVFCTANTVVSKDILECDGTKDCKICTTDIEDFGWDYAIEKWDSTKENGPIPGATCLKISDLPPDLLQCERGIRIQYFLNGIWNTYAAIPSGFTLCEKSGSFNSVDNPELFQNKIRITQYGSELAPPEICPDQVNDFCDADDGFIVSLKIIKQVEKPQLGIVDLVDENILVCSPKLYPNNPNGCFEERLNPCPTCTGKCKPKGFKTPCDKSQGKCDTCPDPLG